MNIGRLIRQLFSSFLLLTVVKKFKSRSSLMKIRAAQVYVLGVKKTRAFFLGGLFVLISFGALINGLSLIQSALFTYSMWSPATKFVVALSLGSLEFLGAIGILIYLFREETWSKFSGIHKVVSSVINEEKTDDKTQDLEVSI